MKLKQFAKWSYSLLFALLLISTNASSRSFVANPNQAKPSELPIITAQELKTMMDKNQSVTVIDVRGADAFASSDMKIKGAIYVKLRRLKYRLGMEPLSSVPRDRMAITYCSCPADEAAINAAQILISSGFKQVRVLKGGWQAWLTAKGNVDSKPKG